MPRVDIEVIEGLFDADRKRELIQRVTKAMVSVEGEVMRGVTCVRTSKVT